MPRRCDPAAFASPSRTVRALACAALLFGADVLGQVRLDDDLFLGTWSPTRSVWQRAIPVCVWSADGRGNYRVVVQGNSVGQRYAMTDGSDHRVEYRLRWFESGTRGRRERLRQGVESRRSYAFRDESGCRDTDRPHLEVQVNRRQIDRAPVGIYRDTLQVTVVPI